MFSIGQIFIDEYPPTVAIWCNKNNAYIEEIEQIDGHRRFQIVVIPEPAEEELAEQALIKAKMERAAAVAAITVEVDGLVFDGDEEAQQRMSRTVAIATANGMAMDTQTTWVLADNTVAQVTLQQLAQACLLAGQKQTELWTKPYEATVA